MARDDSATVIQGNTVVIPVLDNDDGDALSVQNVRRARGVVRIQDDGTLLYRPTPNFVGEDTFEYTINDGRKGRASAQVRVRVRVAQANLDPVAKGDTVATDEDTPVTIDVLANDSDPDQDNLTAELVNGPEYGQLTLNDDGSFTYTPNANFNDSDKFTYTVSDGNGGSATATVTITIDPVNDAPVAADLTVSTSEDTSVAITLTAADVDEGDVLTFEVTDGPANGSLSGDAPNLTYTPDANFNGKDSLTFQVSDSKASDQGLISIFIGIANDLPIASDDTATTDEDTPVTISVLANDSDPDDEDVLSVKSVSQPDSGSAEINTTDSTITYTPDENYNGGDSFTYTVSDNKGGEATASVSVTVNPMNDAPVAVDDTASTQEDVAVIIEVLENDYDVDNGDLLTIQNVRQAQSKGNIIDRENGTLLYTPSPNFSGTDIFYYTIHDVDGLTDEGMVTVTVGGVNDAPVAYDAAFDTQEEVAFSDTLPAFDADGDDLTYSIVNQGTKGTAIITDATINEFTYTPDSDANGQDSFNFRVYDGAAYSNEATVTINIEPVNDAPVITSSPVTAATEGSAYAYNISASDDDAGAILSISAATKPTWLDFTDNGDGTALLSGTPDNADVGDHDVVLAVTDGVIATPVTQSFTITVSNVNDTPVFTSSPVTAATEGSAYAYNISASDDDAGAVLSISAATKPTWLDFTDNGDGTALLSGTPDNADVGDHDVVLAVTDGVIAAPVEQTFTITVSNVNEDPVAVDDEASTDENSPVIINVLENDVDADVGDVLSVASVAYPAHGTVQNNQDGTITYTPDTGFSGSDSFTYTVSDNNGGEASATVTVLVNLEGDLAADVPIDPVEGGTINTDIGVTVEIPGESLSEAVNIQIGTYESIPPGAPQLAGMLYFFGPSGTTFDPPATITVPYDPDLLPEGFDPAGLVLLIYSESDGTWEEALNCTVDTDAETVSGQTYHFCGFAAGLLLDRAPQLIMSLPEPVIEEDAQSTVIIENLAEYFADPNFGDQIDFDVTSPDEGLHALYVTDESALVVDPKPNFYGDIRIVITATDQTGLSVSDTLFLTVTQDNDPSTFPEGFHAALAQVMNINEDQILRVTLMANDIEGDDITFSATSDTSAVTAAIVEDTTLVLIPEHNWYGTSQITVSASDGQDTTHLDPLTLTIEAVNDPPSAFELLGPDDDATIQIQPNNLGDFLTFAWDESIDPDGDQVRYAFMLTDSGAFYFEYGDTTVNEVRVSYADILAAIRDQELTSATFWWTIMAISGQDTIEASDGPYSLTIDISTLAVADPSQLPQLFVLHQNYPNPFNPVTTLKYELPAYCRALLVIYDMRGREVTRLVDGYMGAGYNKVVWNSSDASGRPVPSGIYFARLVTSEYTHIIKMSLIR